MTPHSKQIAETVDYVLDDIITELGCEPDGHKTWAKTTDEIVETIKPILIEALQTAERRGEARIEEYRKVLEQRLSQEKETKGREIYFADQIIDDIYGYFEWLSLGGAKE